ncbi:MAG: protein-disulfide reductase DsbD family protein [Bryobacteraceae bacterium]
MRVLYAILITAVLSPGLSAQIEGVKRTHPLQWKLSLEPAEAPPGAKVIGRLTATIEPGWHLYSMTTPRPPIATRIKLQDSPAVESVQIHVLPPKRAYDPNFQVETETYENEAAFVLEIALRKDAPIGAAELIAEPRYQACDATTCLPPVTRKAAATLKIHAAAPNRAVAIPPEFILYKPPATPASGSPASAVPPPAVTGEPLGQFLAIAFGFGLAAIFTPCVFPMIPITMSFFLNRPSGSRGDGVFHAALFCAGIIVLFAGLGLAVTAAMGPFGVVQLGSNPWVNGFIALVFLMFGLSLLGAFEITIPSGVLTRLDRVSQRGGVLGTLVMGLAFSLTSFACVGPFVGPLLAASAQGGGARPLAGMAVFAAGLSTPFFFLALFPSYLKRLPKSGGWLARVKIVMGFVILAAMLKYVSSIDQVLQWNALTRERFLAAWMVLFALAGLYLLGFLRLEGISKDEPLGLGRLLSGAAFLIFAISLVPGMFCGRLGELDAYIPLPSQGACAASGETGLAWMKNDFRGALAKAKAENKRVFVNFTGYACTNCHWMKANMFPRPEIAEALKQYVLVELYTDGSDAASEENQKLEESKFQTISIPFYAVFDADERVIATFPKSTRDAKEYLDFLKKGLS